MHFRFPIISIFSKSSGNKKTLLSLLVEGRGTNSETEFRDFIAGEASYPSKDQVQNFFKAHPDVLAEIPEKEKMGKLRVKLNNDRRLYISRKNKVNKVLKF